MLPSAGIGNKNHAINKTWGSICSSTSRSSKASSLLSIILIATRTPDTLCRPSLTVANPPLKHKCLSDGYSKLHEICHILSKCLSDGINGTNTLFGGIRFFKKFPGYSGLWTGSRFILLVSQRTFQRSRTTESRALSCYDTQISHMYSIFGEVSRTQHIFTYFIDFQMF